MFNNILKIYNINDVYLGYAKTINQYASANTPEIESKLIAVVKNRSKKDSDIYVYTPIGITYEFYSLYHVEPIKDRMDSNEVRMYISSNKINEVVNRVALEESKKTVKIKSLNRVA